MPFLKVDEAPSMMDAPLAVSPRKTVRMLDCGMTRLYELLNAGELESYMDGGSRKITMRSIHAYVERRLTAERANRAA